MTRANVMAGVLALLAGCAIAAETKEAPKKEPKEEPVPNIGTLSDWERTSNLAEIRDGMFYLDALRAKEPISVFRRDKSFIDADLKVQFRVDAVGTGERAVGLIFGSTDGGTYHCLHIGRRDISLCRVSPDGGRVVLDRRGGFTKPEGAWYDARVECRGDLIRVFFGNRFLFAFKSPDLQPGNEGVYASEGRAWVRRMDFTGKPVRLRKAWKLQ